MKKPTLLIVLMFMAVFSLSACATVKPLAGPWRARVVDAETKEPIVGAAVVAMWDEFHPAFPESRTDYLDAMETMTDKDGMFEIPPRSPIPQHPMGEVGGPYFTIYKPGYGFYSGSQVTIGDNRIEKIGAEPIKISLGKLIDKRSRSITASDAKLEVWSVPQGKKKYLMELYEQEMTFLGLPTDK